MAQLLKPTEEHGGCINFSPYVGNMNPTGGPHPTPQILETLLDQIIATTPARCILTYGVLNGLNHTFLAARNRGIKVIATIWIDGSNTPERNQLSIQTGIESVRLYSDVIEAVGCGVELLVRNSKETSESLLTTCVTQLRAANLDKPIGASDIWYSWGNQRYPVETWPLANQLLDFIGVNVYPWWETRYGVNCISAADAPVFQINTLEMIRRIYPTKFVYLHEYGWPAGALLEDDRVLRDPRTGAICSEATEENQNYVITNTIRLLNKYDLAGAPFTSFREQWKDYTEGGVGSYWGICSGAAPYACKQLWPTTWETNLTVPGLTPVVRPPKPIPTPIPTPRPTPIPTPFPTPVPTIRPRITPKISALPIAERSVKPKASGAIIVPNSSSTLISSLFVIVLMVILL